MHRNLPQRQAEAIFQLHANETITSTRHTEITESAPTEDNHNQEGIPRETTKETSSQIHHFNMSDKLLDFMEVQKL